MGQNHIPIIKKSIPKNNYFLWFASPSNLLDHWFSSALRKHGSSWKWANLSNTKRRQRNHWPSKLKQNLVRECAMLWLTLKTGCFVPAPCPNCRASHRQEARSSWNPWQRLRQVWVFGLKPVWVMGFISSQDAILQLHLLEALGYFNMYTSACSTPQLFLTKIYSLP